MLSLPEKVGSTFNHMSSTILNSKKNTYVYIDGFNFYYGCFKDPLRSSWQRYKWLNLEKLCIELFPNNTIQQIKYYTADITNRPPDKQGDRQKTYLNALLTLPRIKIIKGRFLGPKVVRMPACDEQGNYLGRSTTVLKTEEKGSDVNLAVDLLYDAVKNLYDCAVVISNDSDLISPINIVINDFHKPVGWANPHSKPSQEISNLIRFRKTINESLLRNCQFPPVVDGRFEKPSSW